MNNRTSFAGKAICLFLISSEAQARDALQVQEKYAELLARRAELNRMKEKMRERSQRIEFLRYQINEIDAAAIQLAKKNPSKKSVSGS
jgi:DNA repair ATPase RecN